MKKILLAASLAAVLPLLFSCGKTAERENQFEEPRFVQYAGQLIPRGGAPDPAPAAVRTAVTPVAAEPAINYIEFTESGLYVLGRISEDGPIYSTGTYTPNGNVYTLNGAGITVEFNNSAAGLVDVKITPPGETVKADLKKATGADVAYRSWTIDKVRATVNGFHDPVSAEFNGCNFDEIAKFLDDNGHKGSYLPSGSLKSISFTGAGTVMFAFSDDTADLGDCTISGSSVSFRWRGKNRLFELENGTATLEYLDGKCIFKVRGSLRGSTTSGSVTFVMSPMK